MGLFHDVLDKIIFIDFNHLADSCSFKVRKPSVALAALAATSAFAQVTITGNLDFAGLKVSGTQLGSNGTTFGTTNGTSSTSAINFSAVEDLGGGMRAQAFYAIDPRTLANDSYTVTHASSSVTTNVVTGLARHEMFVHLAGSFGNVRLGSPNSIGLNVQGDSSPMGTATGSGYAPNSGTMMNSIVQTRYNRSIRYDTPTMSGFTASVLYAPGGDQLAVSGTAATQIPNARAATEFGLKYVNGPLTASVAQIKQDDQVNKTGYFSGANTTAAQPKATSATILGVNYKLGNTTLYYGMNTGDRLAVKSSSDGTNVESKGSRFAVKQTMGQIDLMATQTTQETTGAVSNAKAKVTGLTGMYNLSKTSAVYLNY
jgi:predicted porin